jgi:hypothetical protein
MEKALAEAVVVQYQTMLLVAVVDQVAGLRPIQM